MRAYRYLPICFEGHGDGTIDGPRDGSIQQLFEGEKIAKLPRKN